MFSARHCTISLRRIRKRSSAQHTCSENAITWRNLYQSSSFSRCRPIHHTLHILNRRQLKIEMRGIRYSFSCGWHFQEIHTDATPSQSQQCDSHSVHYNTLPSEWWKDKRNQREFMDYLGAKLNITEPQQWYRLTTHQLIAHGGSIDLLVFFEIT